MPWMEAFALARADWEAVIVGHLSSFTTLKSYMEANGKPIGTRVPEIVDDMYIVGKVEPIDGVGMVLGSGKFLTEMLENPNCDLKISNHGL